ncbi:PTS sugar transporter subunit IIC [Salibacterium aidingense]|uniref:PTS sugar transporter subunit IIC n=1 Tax=Salibacterium aidingense TaxID=384933 RepID=UPI0003F8EF5E|nr:PTS transporter subunit EIIC [Salibacterium aidingense]
MEKFISLFEKYMIPLTSALDRSKIFTALREAMLLTIPVIIVGSFALIFSNIPFLDELAPEVNQYLQTFFSHIFPVTLGILAILVLVGISTNYAKLNDVDPVYGLITALISFLTITLFETETSGTQNGEVIENITVQNVIPTNILGAEGIFTAILVAFISVKIHAFVIQKNFTIKMPSSVPPNVSKSFTSLVPMIITVLFFLIIRNIIVLTPFDSLHVMIYTVITEPLTALGNNVFSILFLTFVQQVLWFVGIHGTSILNAVWGPVEQTMTGANLAAFQAGEPLPYILTQPFREVYGVGGAQGILAAIVATMIVRRSKQMRTVSRLSITPGLFNIQEPFHFGAPTFLNPILFIPYVFIPVIQVGLAYVAVIIGFAPVPVTLVPWTTPIILSGLLSTDFNIMGAVLQLILFALAVVLWIPFIKTVDRGYLHEEQENKEGDS